MINLILERQLKKAAQEFGILNKPPLIIIGMHRSGTSIVTRVLREAGGYFGYQLDPNSESLIFLRLNHNFLAYSGVSWDSIPEYFDSNSFPNNIKVVLCLLSNRHLLWSDFFQFFGRPGNEGYKLEWNEYWLPWLDFKGLPNFKKHTFNNNAAPFWGWKDPRTTLTLPIWLKLFPNAKVIHVIRNGIDASLSLWRRSKITGEGAPHCLDLKYCFELWEKYAQEGIRWRSLHKDRYIEIRYEDLLDDPISCLNMLLSFAGAPASMASSLSNLVISGQMKSHTSEGRRELIDYASRSPIFCHLKYHK